MKSKIQILVAIVVAFVVSGAAFGQSSFVANANGSRAVTNMGNDKYMVTTCNTSYGTTNCTSDVEDGEVVRAEQARIDKANRANQKGAVKMDSCMEAYKVDGDAYKLTDCIALADKN